MGDDHIFVAAQLHKGGGFEFVERTGGDSGTRKLIHPGQMVEHIDSWLVKAEQTHQLQSIDGPGLRIFQTRGRRIVEGVRDESGHFPNRIDDGAEPFCVKKIITADIVQMQHVV